MCLENNINVAFIASAAEFIVRTEKSRIVVHGRVALQNAFAAAAAAAAVAEIGPGGGGGTPPPPPPARGGGRGGPAAPPPSQNGGGGGAPPAGGGLCGGGGGVHPLRPMPRYIHGCHGCCPYPMSRRTLGEAHGPQALYNPPSLGWSESHALKAPFASVLAPAPHFSARFGSACAPYAPEGDGLLVARYSGCRCRCSPKWANPCYILSAARHLSRKTWLGPRRLRNIDLKQRTC